MPSAKEQEAAEAAEAAEAIEREWDEWDEMDRPDIPNVYPEGWDAQFEAAHVGSKNPIEKEISLDHATPAQWKRFLESLGEDESG